MPTFLTTRKMSPALAARIEASVRGRRGRAGKTSHMPRLIALARVGALVLVVLAIGSVVHARRRDRQAIDSARAALLDEVRGHAASLAEADQAAIARIAAWLQRMAGRYEGDMVADEARAPGALAAILDRPAVYVRGPIDALSEEETAAASSKDPLLTCLVDPPTARSEKALLTRVRATYATGGPTRERTAHVHRLHDLERGLPYLLPPFSDRIRATQDLAEIAALRREIGQAPIDEAKRAAAAKLLVVAVDEAGDGPGPAELDGERAHAVRLALIDLARGAVLLRMRKRVDPSWITAASRAEHANGIDGCALAFDVREAMNDARAAKPVR